MKTASATAADGRVKRTWQPLLAVATLMLTACASVSTYAPTTTDTARVRFVAQGVGNIYFAVPRQPTCSKTFGSVLDDGDKLIAVLQGTTTPGPKFGSMPVIGMPDGQRHPDWTYLETKVDANQDLLFRTTLVSSNGSPYDVGMCNAVLGVRLAPGKDYELVMSGRGPQCSVAVFELAPAAGGSVSRVPVTPFLGPRGCGAAK